ncbi:hypothetical protein Pan216_44720 [Planctomycetes bacterium Pan216]|uniref:Ser-Thr-rich glycosyl-phosphatidyl-inositol-anchored membrane family protein n=1 Tax=Kolteria novifilia TaxID=2527975 RepID=A0A518B9D3_9BACT|nr:hypothetical protein Pan216_44720 [Planctomycetes bacterium Pan216]
MFGLMPMAAAMATLAFGAGDTESDLIYSPERVFRIPLDLNEAERERIKLVRVFVSGSHGNSWTRLEDGKPDTKTVTFQAKRDGEYWFSVALIDRDGRQTPGDISAVEPGLKVLVDSQDPDLVLRPIRSRSGHRGVRWEVTDANPKANALRLAVWDDKTSAWKSYPIETPEKNLVWFKQDESFQKIQAQITDRAGRATVMEVMIEENQFAKRQVDTFALDQAEEKTVATRIPRAFAKKSPPVQQASHTPEPKPAMASAAVTEKSAAPMAPSKMPEPAKAPEPPKMPSATADAQLRPEGRSFCASRRLVVHYEVDKSGKEVGPVELWGSTDGGENWTVLSRDTDKTSPIEAELGHDGTWGLRIVVDADLPMSRPTPGSTPELYVEIDTTSPVVLAKNPVISDGMVELTWSAADQNLSSESTNIFYATNPEGPWKQIGESLEGTGRFVWELPESNTKNGSQHFRIEARDEAGNVGDINVVARPPLANIEQGGRLLRVAPFAAN